jgi:hypothetical protein
MKKIFYLFCLSIIVISVPLYSQVAKKTSSKELKPPVQLTSEQDHQRVMKLLGIDTLRPGPSGDPKAPNAANIDESKASPYTSLPDPLVLKNGKKVNSPKVWRDKRRKEIFEDFDREIYGRVPKNVPKVKWKVVKTKNDTIGSNPVVTKELSGHVDNSSYPLIDVNIQLTLTTPANTSGPVPVIIEFGFDFSKFKSFDVSKLPPDFDSWKKQILDKGWGFAVLVPTSVQEDNGAGLTNGIIGLCNKGMPRKVDDWGALRAWAWAASRCIDYFETDKSVEAKKIGIEGLSRYGKATLVTMAYDERFAIAFVGSSGAAGAKIHRRFFGEQVENIASSSEYHWMAGNYIKYAGPLTPNDLPVDSHELIALCAPRPVFIGVGSPSVEGQWVDARGMFLAAVNAGQVYKLLGKKDLGITEFPPMETTWIDGDIAFRQHSGGHTNAPNWETFLKFAERYFSK